MPWDALDVASSSSAPVDPDALPEPDADTKAYFREVASKIQEMEEMGHGRPREPVDEDDEIEDDRPYLLRSALESLSGHEIPLAGDGETSLILEKLLYSMDDFARRVLADRFAGNYAKLVKHRAASHVLQTLFTLSGETVDREVHPDLVKLSCAPQLTLRPFRLEGSSLLPHRPPPPTPSSPP